MAEVDLKTYQDAQVYAIIVSQRGRAFRLQGDVTFRLRRAARKQREMVDLGCLLENAGRDSLSKSYDFVLHAPPGRISFVRGKGVSLRNIFYEPQQSVALHGLSMEADKVVVRLSDLLESESARDGG